MHYKITYTYIEPITIHTHCFPLVNTFIDWYMIDAHWEHLAYISTDVISLVKVLVYIKIHPCSHSCLCWCLMNLGNFAYIYDTIATQHNIYAYLFVLLFSLKYKTSFMVCSACMHVVILLLYKLKLAFVFVVLFPPLWRCSCYRLPVSLSSIVEQLTKLNC